MEKLRLISVGMMILGFILLLGGFVVSMKELAEYGVYIVITGIIGYSVMFLMGSTIKKNGTGANF